MKPNISACAEITFLSKSVYIPRTVTLLLSRCPFNQMAKLDLEGPDTTFVTVVVYNDLIKAIVEQDQQTTTSLLKAKPFDITYNQYHVATSVSRRR